MSQIINVSNAPLSTYWVSSGATEHGILLSANSIDDLMDGNFFVEFTEPTVPGEKWAYYHEGGTQNNDVLYFIKGNWPGFELSFGKDYNGYFNALKYSVGNSPMP